MAFALNKANRADKAKMLAELVERAATVSAAIAAYNETLANVRELAADIVQTARDEWNDKSERWQEGDRGANVDEWISEWEDADFEELDEPEFHADMLDNLPEVAA